MKPMALSPIQQRRLEALARETGRTPAQTLKFVLRDGFDFCEWEVRENRMAEESMRRNGPIPNAQVRRDAQRIIDAARGRKSRKAA